MTRTEQRTVIDPEAKAALDYANGMTVGAQAMLTDAQARQADAMAREQDVTVQALERTNAEAAQRQAMVRRKIGATQAQLGAINAELDADKGINAEKFWEDKGTGSKILGAIAMALGALGGSELPTKIIENAINREIDAQRANLAQKNAKVTRYGQAIQQYREVLGDDRAADAAAKRDMLEAAAKRIEAQMSASDSDVVKAKGAAAIADLQKKAAEYGVQITSRVESNAWRTVPKQTIDMRGRANGGMTSDIDPEKYIPEAGGFVVGKTEEAGKIKDKFMGINEMSRLLGEVTRVGSSFDKRADPRVQAELKSLAGQLTIAMKNKETMGALDKGTQEISDQVMGDPTALVGSGRERVIAGLQRGLANSKLQLQRTYGIVPGRVEVAQDPRTGQRKVVGRITGNLEAPSPVSFTPAAGGGQ
jgi:hypothetical protein